MKKMKKILFVMLIVLIINLTFITNISNASIFGSDLASGAENFENRGSNQLKNLGIQGNILDGLWDYVGDVFFIVVVIAFVTTLVIIVMTHFKGIGSDGGKIYTAEERKQLQRQILLVLALFGGVSLIGLLLTNFL